MKKLLHFAFILIVFCPIIGVLVSSCDDESDCSIAGRATLRATIHTITNDRVVNDTLDSLTVTALYTDSIILNNQMDVTELYIPLRYTSDTTFIVLHFSRQTRDTLTIRHTNNPKFISMDCGYEMKQAITSINYTRHRLDSIHITNTTTSTDGTRNFQFFF